MIALMRKVADPGTTEGARWADMRVHMVRNPIMTELGYSSKLNAEWAFLSMLRDEGRRPPRLSSRRTAPISANDLPSTSTGCCKGCEALAERKWNFSASF